MSEARFQRLKASARIYLNPEIITQEIYQEALGAKLDGQTSKKASNNIHFQNLAVGICHVQEADLLVDHILDQNDNALATEKATAIADKALPILLLSSPALNFAYGLASNLTQDQQGIYIKGMFRNLFHATQQQGRTHIALPAAGLGVFGGDPKVYFDALMKVAKEFPNLNIIYHPAQYGNEFNVSYETHESPQNVARATKDVMFIADALCKEGIPCAYHNPSDADVVLGIYGPGEYWQDGRGNGYVGEEHVGAMSTAPLGGRGFNPEAYEKVTVMQVKQAQAASAQPVLDLRRASTAHTPWQENHKPLHEAIRALKTYSESLTSDKNFSPDRYLAGNNGINLADKLLKQDPMSDDFQTTLNQGYTDMGENRRLGYFHSFLITISKALSALKARIVGNRENAPKTVKIGEVTPGFFNLTTRQAKIVAIQQELAKLAPKSL